MKQPTFIAWFFLPVFLGMLTGVSANSWSCLKADLTRQVLLFYPDAPALLPCKVFYSKPRENVIPRVLWESANTQYYCERKAAEFVAKLESWGWRCAEDDPQAATSREPEKMPAMKFE